MNETEFQRVCQAILDAAVGDLSIMAGLVNVDLSNEQLRFTRVLEICEKVEALRNSDDEDTDVSEHYNWYGNLGLDDVRGQLTAFWAQRRMNSATRRP